MLAMLESFEVKQGDPLLGPIEVFSDRRLPFEPKGWLVELRSAIRNSVASLMADAESILHATYVSPVSGLFDVENVLFYNVGATCFQKASSHGLLFERGFGPPPQAPSGQMRPHYHSYSIQPRSVVPSRWMIGETLATWSTDLSGLQDPSRVWLETQPSLFLTNKGLEGFDGPFGLDIELQVPARKGLNVASAMKPLLDGLISALHAYDGTPPGEVVRRLAKHLEVDEQSIRMALANRNGALLQPRRLVVTRRNGVQWNPADDLCHVCKIRVTYEAAAYAVSGSVFNLLPRRHASLGD